MLTSVACSNLVFSHGQTFDTNKNISEALAKEFVQLKRAKVVEEDVVVEQVAPKKRTTRKVKSDES